VERSEESDLCEYLTMLQSAFIDAYFYTLLTIDAEEADRLEIS
jgi:hypothetical protein